jgi:hypothetical protein
MLYIYEWLRSLGFVNESQLGEIALLLRIRHSVFEKGCYFYVSDQIAILHFAGQ